MNVNNYPAELEVVEKVLWKYDETPLKRICHETDNFILKKKIVRLEEIFSQAVDVIFHWGKTKFDLLRNSEYIKYDVIYRYGNYVFQKSINMLKNIHLIYFLTDRRNVTPYL